MTPIELMGKSALVTGSTQGIGRAIADGMRDSGAGVVYHGLAAAPDLGSACLVEDLMAGGAPQRLIKQAIAVLPALDTLVCNAGGFFDAPFLEMTPAVWDRTFNLNVRAPYFLAQSFARHLVSQGRGGSIILVASTNGFQAEPDSTAYDTSKGALVMLTRTLAVSLAPYNIRVNCLAPGVIRTPLTETWINTNEPLRLHYEKTIPLQRIGVPTDCSGAAVFLASDAAAYITGQILIVDGGLTVSQIGPL